MAACPNPEASGSIGAMQTAAKLGERTATKRSMASFGFAMNINSKAKMLWLNKGDKRVTCSLKKGKHHVEAKTSWQLPGS